jgi:hypothetical protein
MHTYIDAHIHIYIPVQDHLVWWSSSILQNLFLHTHMYACMHVCIYYWLEKRCSSTLFVYVCMHVCMYYWFSKLLLKAADHPKMSLTYAHIVTYLRSHTYNAHIHTTLTYIQCHLPTVTFTCTCMIHTYTKGGIHTEINRYAQKYIDMFKWNVHQYMYTYTHMHILTSQPTLSNVWTESHELEETDRQTDRHIGVPAHCQSRHLQGERLPRGRRRWCWNQD